MSLRVVIQAAAKKDILQARNHYREIDARVGTRFLLEVDRAITRAQDLPLAFPILQRTFRRVLLHTFPYALFFHAGEDRIVVVAVLHQARDPDLLNER